ncbi:uncharacterized protein MONBRDRAFT_38272 [Monosiga brevicollis MX1]|uniref:Uncharacterized protein n=1 Tax=Monosiga brevicollis TaxID=81824 RepID=A9V6E9_MONBE|nr:uncharacterized protein MONBRDRAFT_38272 [Monosiga brevicollis MX1]EDQ86870.1 predicted protein [Monosiga brevicollis MX1]|eukprot:XP_001748415.1 hypothetical protein [Monosiga brevicollis MX1]
MTAATTDSARRLQEVREQEREFARRVRDGFNQERQRLETRVLHQLENEWRDELARERQLLAEDYQLCLTQMGRGHVSALEHDQSSRVAAQKKRHLELAQRRAAVRSREAKSWLQDEQKRIHGRSAAAKARWETVRIQERERAQAIAAEQRRRAAERYEPLLMPNACVFAWPGTHLPFLSRSEDDDVAKLGDLILPQRRDAEAYAHTFMHAKPLSASQRHDRDQKRTERGKAALTRLRLEKEQLQEQLHQADRHLRQRRRLELSDRATMLVEVSTHVGHVRPDLSRKTTQCARAPILVSPARFHSAEQSDKPRWPKPRKLCLMSVEVCPTCLHFTCSTRINHRPPRRMASHAATSLPKGDDTVYGRDVEPFDHPEREPWFPIASGPTQETSTVKPEDFVDESQPRQPLRSAAPRTKAPSAAGPQPMRRIVAQALVHDLNVPMRAAPLQPVVESSPADSSAVGPTFARARSPSVKQAQGADKGASRDLLDLSGAEPEDTDVPTQSMPPKQPDNAAVAADNLASNEASPPAQSDPAPRLQPTDVSMHQQSDASGSRARVTFASPQGHTSRRIHLGDGTSAWDVIDTALTPGGSQPRRAQVRTWFTPLAAVDGDDSSDGASNANADTQAPAHQGGNPEAAVDNTPASPQPEAALQQQPMAARPAATETNWDVQSAAAASSRALSAGELRLSDLMERLPMEASTSGHEAAATATGPQQPRAGMEAEVDDRASVVSSEALDNAWFDLLVAPSGMASTQPGQSNPPRASSQNQGSAPPVSPPVSAPSTGPTSSVPHMNTNNGCDSTALLRSLRQDLASLMEDMQVRQANPRSAGAPAKAVPVPSQDADTASTSTLHVRTALQSLQASASLVYAGRTVARRPYPFQNPSSAAVA